MSTKSEIWKSSRFTIERSASENNEAVFHFTGPFTARDMYTNMSPDDFRNIFQPLPGDAQPSACTFDLSGVPYMDSMGLGMLASHYVRCQSRGVQLSITGAGTRVMDLFRLTKMDTVLPIVDFKKMN